MKNDPLMRVI